MERVEAIGVIGAELPTSSPSTPKKKEKKLSKKEKKALKVFVSVFRDSR